MRQILALVILSAFLAGCVSSHSFYLMGRTTGVSGSGKVPANGHAGGDITITLAGKDFKGRWIYMQTGGSAEIAFASSSSGKTATGTAIGFPTGGNGSVSAAASDGSVLHCAFNFSEWNLKGVGICQDNNGETYDLQIS